MVLLVNLVLDHNRCGDYVTRIVNLIAKLGFHGKSNLVPINRISNMQLVPLYL